MNWQKIDIFYYYDIVSILAWPHHSLWCDT